MPFIGYLEVSILIQILYEMQLKESNLYFFYLNNFIIDKIRFEWANIIYDMPKAIQHTLINVRKSYNLLSYQTTIIPLLSGGPLCIRYKLGHFMVKAFPLLKLIITSIGWGAVSTIFKVFGMIRTRTWDLPI